MTFEHRVYGIRFIDTTTNQLPFQLSYKMRYNAIQCDTNGDMAVKEFHQTPFLKTMLTKYKQKLDIHFKKKYLQKK